MMCLTRTLTFIAVCRFIIRSIKINKEIYKQDTKLKVEQKIKLKHLISDTSPGNVGRIFAVVAPPGVL